MMKALLIAALALLAPLSQEVPIGVFAVSQGQKERAELKKQKSATSLQTEIESLANLRDYYVARMTRYRNRAARIEFQEGGDLELAKQLAQHADQLEGVVKQIEMELSRLEKQLEGLLKS